SRRRRARRGASGRRHVVTPSLVSVWLHLLGVVTWMGGLMYQAHVLVPAARRDGAAPLAETLRRGRRVTWIAVALVALTGFYNVTWLGPLDQVLESGAALLLALKFMLVLAAVAIAGQRDFAQVPRLARLIGERRGLSEPGDLDARVLQLVAPVDRRENRGDALERSGVAQDADVDRTKAHRAPELTDGILGGGIAAAEEQIALDRALSLGQLVGRDVVEG